ncbi:hypothetical protein GCM10027597_64550 [Saccharopolyspora tripterygii]
MSQRPTLFGAELRRLRTEAGLSLSRMAGLLHYSKGYLSKIETGGKRPSPDFARRCDAELDAGGKLSALVPDQSPRTPPPSEITTNGDEVWVLRLDSSGGSSFQPMDRRSVLTAGAASAVAFGMGGTRAAVAGTGSLEPFQVMFDQLRTLGQTASPSLVLPGLIAQTHSLRELAFNAPPRHAPEILALTARYAEFAGWMTQEAGDDRAAMWWTDKSVELAEAGGDHRLSAYALVRRALVEIYRHDARQAIDVAQLARQKAITDRVRGWAALHEAQGHALAGDYDTCMRTLDVAREHLSAAQPEPGPTLGASNLSDPVAMIAGWCLHDLGRTGAATEVLDREVGALPEQALRSRARYGIRQALAHATDGEIERACAITTETLPIVDAVTSATVLTDLRKLSQMLARHHRVPAVQALQPALIASLHHQSA